MSATGRGAKRAANDFYTTPASAAHALVRLGTRTRVNARQYILNARLSVSLRDEYFLRQDLATLEHEASELRELNKPLPDALAAALEITRSEHTLQVRKSALLREQVAKCS